MQTKNAPSFIYSLINPNEKKLLRGRFEDAVKTKYYEDIEFDEAIPEKALRQLFSIEEIETRSSCQGHNKERPTFLIFRFSENKTEEYINGFVECMNKQEGIICGYDLGNEGQFRIGVTANIYYTDKNRATFEKWWESLPEKIDKCLGK